MLRVHLQWTFLILFLIFSVVLCNWVPKKPENQQICNSQTCKDRGIEYQKNMVRSVNPCEDFYTFACGNWETNHPNPPYTDWDVAHRMDHHTLAILRKILEQLPAQQTDRKVAKLKFIYDTCLQIPYFDKHEPRDIGAQIGKIGRYPAKKLWDLHNEYLKVTGESALFDIDVGGFDDNLDLPILQLAEPLSVFGSIFHDTRWQLLEEQSYTQALFEMMSSLGLQDSPDTLKRRIASVFQFRRKLNSIFEATIQLDEDENPIQLTPMRMEKAFLDLVIPLYRNKATLAIPFTQIARILFHKITPALVMSKNIILFHKAEYFKRLANLLAVSSEQDIADHMEIYFVERHLKRTPKVKQLLQNTWRDPPPTVKTVRFDEPRWMTCIRESDMDSTLAKLFINNWLKVEHKNQVKDIMDGIKVTIKQQVTESKWLNEDAKVLTFERLDEVEELIGEPTKRREAYSPVKKIFPTAFLDFDQDLMFVHAAMLQSPIFDPTLPPLYNLATTGFMLGHEFYHVIDDCGSHRVSAARSSNLWPEKMRNKCQDRKKCFITQYDKFTKLEFKRRYNLSPKQIDTTLSFVENYPDVMGLEAAYMLHSKILKRDGGKCAVLPGFAGYSCDQMFFLAFANMHCGIPPAKRAVTYLTEDMHSINPVRVNGALSSTKAFTNAFQCGRLDTMNPFTKCNLWI